VALDRAPEADIILDQLVSGDIRGVSPLSANAGRLTLSPALDELNSVMEKNDPSAYERLVGPDYDALYPDPPDTQTAVLKLAELAGEGALLEFGIGTGRLGVPLVERGVTVAGIEGSSLLADQLRAKPRGEEINVLVGDFSDTLVPGSFSVVALAVNTIFAMATREHQIECFANARRHLSPGGCFVVEAFILRGEQLEGRWYVQPRTVVADHVELQVARYDPAVHLIERTLVHLTPSGSRFFSVIDNYAWPGELDLIARASGLQLRSRWGGWDQEPFTAASEKHVSVYEVPHGPPAVT